MLDALKTRLARRRALKLVGQRAVQPWAADPAARRVLVVLPAGEAKAKEAWRFLGGLGIPEAQIVPVVPSGLIAFTPAAFIGRIKRLDEKAVDLLGLPKREVAEALWTPPPDLAFCLTPAFDLGAAALVGASPAAFRIGLAGAAAGAEPFFDLTVAPSDSFASALAVLETALGKIEPPVVGGPLGSR